MLEDYQILILGSMLAGYLVLRALEGVITSIIKMKKEKAHEEYTKDYDKMVEEHQKHQDKMLNKDERGLEKKNE